MTTTTKITEITDRAACAVWSPLTSGFVALGGKDSGLVTFDSATNGYLEIYSINVTGEEPILKAKISCSSRFASIAWTPYKGSSEQEQYSEGLIAGGMQDGTILLFNAAAIINGDVDNSLLGTVPAPAPKSGPVEAIQFSSLDTFNLCAGTYSGHVTIVDCTSATSTTTRSFGPVTAEITAIAWNTAVAHIVATAQGDGSVTVWDCNTSQPWCEIRAEHAGQAVMDVAWNPAQGLHLLTASGDDRNPLLKWWDLAASTSVPIATMAGHSAGIFKTAWCPHDDSLMLTVAKDNRTLLWDLRSLAAVAELPVDSAATPEQQQQTNSAGALFASGRPGLAEQKQQRVSVQWSPFQRGVALTCSLDRKVQIHSLLSLANCTGRPPAWMTPRSAVSTGFGGMLIHCGQGTGGTVTIRTIQEEPKLAETSQALETELMQHRETIIEFCKLQQENVEAPQDKAMWGFMQVVFETNARQVLLWHLGFDAEEIAATAQKYSKDLISGDVQPADAGSDRKCMPEAAQDLVKRALVVGNYEAAVDICLETGSFADALILAAVAGGDLWGTAQERFFASESGKRSYLTSVSCIVRGQLDVMVANSDTALWHETLAILSTYSQAEDFPTLCMALGDRLQEAGDESSASLCYMCALNLDCAVRFWHSQLLDKVSSSEFTATADLLSLHEFIVKVSVFAQAAGPSGILTPEIEDLFTKYSQALAEQGLLVTATKYCRGSNQSSRELRDRLYRSRASHRCYAYLGAAPEFPYEMADVQQSRGQVMAQPKVAEPERQPATITNGIEHTQQADYGQQQQQAAQANSHYQNGQQQQEQHAHQTQGYAQAGGDDVLPPDWVKLQDPGSGMAYYYNQTTGETTWDRPKPPAPAPQPTLSTPQATFGVSQQQIPTQDVMDVSARSQNLQPSLSKPKNSLAAKYGDGFVTSASNPLLANQYGNVGTSNPYGEVDRPGTAASVLQFQSAPISGSLNFDKLQLSNHHHSIKDTLLGTAEALKGLNLNPVEKRQLAEAEKGVAILVKKMAMDALSEEINEQVYALTSSVSARDFGTASHVQTLLANNEWREHKDWLKGIKILIQLASKKLS